MTRTIAGALDPQAMARLHFSILDRDQQAAAIQRLALTQGENTISHVTGWSVEAIRRVLSERERA